MAPQLETRRLAKSFPGSVGSGSLEVLAGIDLCLDRGEFVSVLGPSGCGKTTLLSLIAGLEQPTSGEILLDGSPDARLLGEVGLMPQADLLMPWRSVLDNVALPLELAGLRRRDSRRQAESELDRFGLEGFGDAWPHQLSGGMRQRAALLRTFLSGHRLLLLDEPLGALDAMTRQAMQRWLADVCRESAKTVVFVTHDVEEALMLSDRVYLLSPRPATVELVVEVDLPRPRIYRETSTDPRFVALKAELLQTLSPATAGTDLG